MSYREMSKTLLNQHPEEKKHLQEAGILDQALDEVSGLFNDQEQTIIAQMTSDLPADLPYQERVQEMNRARSVAREVVAADLAEFWASMK